MGGGLLCRQWLKGEGKMGSCIGLGLRLLTSSSSGVHTSMSYLSSQQILGPR